MEMTPQTSSSNLHYNCRSKDPSSGGVRQAPKTVPGILDKEDFPEETTTVSTPISVSASCISTEFTQVSTDSIVGGGTDPDLNASSKKALDDLHEIVFSILEQGGSVGTDDGRVFRRKMNIAITTFLLVVALFALVSSFMKDDCSFPPELTPT